MQRPRLSAECERWDRMGLNPLMVQSLKEAQCEIYTHLLGQTDQWESQDGSGPSFRLRGLALIWSSEQEELLGHRMSMSHQHSLVSDTFRTIKGMQKGVRYQLVISQPLHRTHMSTRAHTHTPRGTHVHYTLAHT